jgi:SAM-dependent methyltransferase
LERKMEEIVCCPMCGASLNRWRCSKCSTEYPTANGQPDLRLRGTKHFNMDLVLNAVPDVKRVSVMRPSARTEVAFSPGVSLGRHFDRSLATYLPSGNGEYALDLGCGEGSSQSALEHAGYKYVSMDFNSKDARILADAHAIPFRDQSFKAVLFLAVLEHLQHPYVALREAFRVLKPGGVIVGTVAFLEPWHGNSYYHHSPLGTLNTLQQAGFEITLVAPKKEWAVLKAQAIMGLFPALPSFASLPLVMPIQLLHRLYWRLARLVVSKATELNRQAITTGAFYFVGRKAM